jgi:ABC-type amino acid transport substrate-binding protein
LKNIRNILRGIFMIEVIKRIICVIAAAALFASAFSGCRKTPDENSGVSSEYTALEDVPDITADEIAAVKKLREQYESFVYAMTENTETFYGENGEINGFSALFCDWLTELFGIPFRPEIYEWGEMLAALENGEAHFTGEMTASEERRKTYYMTGAIAERSIKTYRIAGSPPLSSVAESRIPRYIFFGGTTTIDDVSALLDGEYEILLAYDIETVYNMLKSGEADAFFNESSAEASFDSYGDVIAEDFFPLTYSPVSLTAQNPDLEPVISVVQKALQSELRHLTELYNRGHQEYMKHKVSVLFTDEEREYIRNHPVIPVAAESDNYPVSFYNSREKQWQGIIFDVFGEINKLTGLSFEIVHEEFTVWDDLLKMLEEGKAAVISELVRSEEREGRFLWSDVTLLSDSYALLSKAEYRNININEILYMKVGTVKGSVYDEVFKS